MYARCRRTIIEFAFALVIGVALVGCESYGPYNLNLRTDDQLVENGQRYEVDILGTREPWDLTMDEYFSKRAVQLRESGRVRTLWFDESNPTRTVSSNDKIWKSWRSSDTRYLFIIPHLQSWAGRKGVTLSLSSKADGGDGKASGYDLVVYGSWIDKTPVYK